MGGTDSKSGSRPYTGPGRASSSGPRFTAGRRIPRRRAGRWQAFVLWPLVAFAALAAGAAAFFVVAAPVDLVRDHLVAQFKHRTGRDLEIAGTTSLGFWPRFTVTVRDVAMPPPPGMEGAPLARIAAIEAAVPLWPLLRRRVLLEGLVVRRPEIALRIDGEGRRSWDFGGLRAALPRASRQASAPEPAADGAGGRLPQMTAPREVAAGAGAEAPGGGRPALRVRIEDGIVRYTDERTAAREEIGGIGLDLLVGDADAPVALSGAASWHGEVLTVAAEIGSLRQALGSEPAPVSIKLAGAPFEAVFSGRAAAAGEPWLAGGLDLRTGSLQRLAEWAGAILPGAGGALTLTGQLEAGRAAVRLADARLTLDGATAAGAVAVETAGTRPHVTAEVEVDRLDADAFLRPARPSEDAGRRPPGGREGSSADGERSDERLDLAALAAFDADVRLTAGAVAYKELRLGRTRLTASLAGGVLRTNIGEAELYGGRGGGTFDVDAGGETPSFEASLVLEDVAALPFLAGRTGFDWIDGKAKLTLALVGRGASERDVVASLAGSAELDVRNGAIVGLDLPRIVRGLEEGRIPSLDRNPGDRTPFSRLAATFRIENGEARTSDLALTGPHFGAGGAGTTDLVRRRLDYAVRAHLVSPGKPGESGGQGGKALGGVELPLRISGPWRSPRIAADIGGVVKNPDRVIGTAKEIGRQFKGKSIDEAVRGLLGKGTEEDNEAGRKAKELLKGLLR